MSLNALGIALVGLWLLRRRPPHGLVTGWIFIHYSITRFVIESFRGDEVRGVWFGGALSTSQLIAIPGVLVGILILVWAKKRGGRTPANPAEAGA